MVSPRTNPTSVRPAPGPARPPASSARTPRPASGIPASTAFWVSSNDARPDTTNIARTAAAGPRAAPSRPPCPRRCAGRRPPGRRPSRRRRSSRPAACSPPVLSNARCCSRSRSGAPQDQLGRHPDVSVQRVPRLAQHLVDASSCRRCRRRWWSARRRSRARAAATPSRQPHVHHVVGVHARPVRPRRSSGRARHLRRRRSRPRCAAARARGRCRRPGVRIVTRNGLAVQPDLQRLLHRERVAAALRRARPQSQHRMRCVSPGP